MFAKNNLHFEGIIWSRPSSTKDRWWEIYCKVFRLFDYYRHNEHGSLSLESALQAIAITFGSSKRTNEVYLPCGIKAITPARIDENLSCLLNKLSNKIKEKNKDMFDDLVALEYVAPYSEYSSSIVKILWNICRILIRQPFAFIPLVKKDIYYRKIATRYQFQHKV